MLQLYIDKDIQKMFAQKLQKSRKSQKLSRATLSQKSNIPAPTIRRFEETGEISLRQFLRLWMVLEDIGDFIDIANPAPARTITDFPKTLEEAEVRNAQKYK